MRKTDWEAIRREYETDGVSARKLAEKYGISHTAINQRAKAESWRKPEKKNPEKKVSTKKISAEKVERKKVETRSLETVKKLEEAGERVSKPRKIKKGSDDDFYSFDPADFGLSEKQGIFAENVAAGKKLVEAYRIAGYDGEGASAHSCASKMLRNAKVYRAVSFLRDKRQQRLSLTEDEIIHQLSAIASANPNELVQYRRVNCRYCWGERHLYQWRDIEEFDKAAEKASQDGKDQPEYGGLGFVETGFPNEDCPKCNGEGETQLFVADTSQLEGDARWLYAGIKQTQNGLEVRMANQEAARRDLLKIIEARKNRLIKNASDDPPDEESDISDEQLHDALRSLGYGRFSAQLSDREKVSNNDEQAGTD
ncbi:terminase small subunit [Klebsiella oxytoca]|uniref:terminase small subunit n=1 Tax=Klebsiella oxytoca TaxID=571 RepID=UPI0007CC8F12|nr:terminase small subunit [Klebsiella oxytoca]MCW9590813.1 terminase small subunit [Klebsiella oxytoca]MCW9603662.1 terminase small subunit [Klebsiella oxytoca]MCW9624951.1 terminase small subunit [Klebsiella oxytoca]SAQ53002.1 terminase small subunit [Klebsiella oxytoca]